MHAHFFDSGGHSALPEIVIENPHLGAACPKASFADSSGGTGSNDL